MSSHTETVAVSDAPCWRCGTPLWRLTPPVQGGWAFSCPACQHLTLTRAEAEQALRTIPAGAIGVVVAVPYRLDGSTTTGEAHPAQKESLDGHDV
jgi:hypothetical protein